MNQEDLLAQLKKDVRSLLISSKLGLEMERLKADYASMLGKPMPLRQLGFRNTMEMVREMPDVVAVDFRAEGQVWLTAVGDEKTQNIEDLVAKQRMRKKDVIKRPLYTPRPLTLRPAVVLPRRGATQVAVPAELRTQLRILLSQGPLLLSNFESSFQRCFGYQLRPQNYGFYSTGEMLEAAADLICRHQTRMGSAVSLKEHKLPPQLPELFTQPKRTGLTKSVPVRVNQNFHMRNTRPTITTKSLAPVKTVSPVVQPSIGETSQSVHQRLSAITSEQQTAEKTPGEPNIAPHLEKFAELEEELRQKIIANGVAGTVSQELKDKLRQVVRESSDGLSVHRLPAEYKRLFGEDLPLHQNGFVSATEMMGALMDTFHLEPVSDASGPQWKVVEILHSHAKQSDSRAAKSLDEPSAVNKVVDRESSSNSEPEQEKDGALECRRMKLSNGIKTLKMVHYRGALPPDAMQSRRLRRQRCLRPRELVQVQVEEVDSPGHFYISYSNSEEAEAMDNMMLEMRRCYNFPEVSEPYRLTLPFVRRGQVCCVSPKGVWFYRAVIHHITSPAEVEVYFVDFGSRNVVPISSLKFLKSCYSVLPAQAVLASLAGIKPPAGGWSAEATASFQKMCPLRPLVGAADCYAGDVLQLYLCDTSTDEDIYIHSVLLSQGHGTPCSPMTITQLCVKANPVSLYLGEGMVDLPEITEEDLTKPRGSMSALVKEEHHLVASDLDYDDLPGLVLIENAEVSCCNQDSSLFNLSGIDPIVNYSGSDWASTNGSHKTSLPSPSPILRSDLDLFQSDTDAARTSAPDASAALSPAPSCVTAASCSPAPGDEPLQVTDAAPCSVRAPPAVTTLSVHTPDLSQCFPGSPLKLHKAGVLFPLFGKM